MLDTPLRPFKDQVFNPLCRYVPAHISPTHLTCFAFLCGLISCLSTATDFPVTSLLFWLLNRALDCLDGGVARYRSQQSDLGGFLDLLGDFIIYSAIPISCGLSKAARDQDYMGNGGLWQAIAVVEASFHVNNFVLFYVGAVVEKMKATNAMAAKKKGRNGREEQEADARVKQLTSVAMRPALVEGVESAIMFTVMLAQPAWTEYVCWLMAVLVSVGICQRIIWVVPHLG